jgi:serine/threonine protein kinase/outer membrane protein OmpA-like peptidoglycan-associated protein
MKQHTQKEKHLKNICFQCMRIRKNEVVCDHCGYDFRLYKQNQQFLSPGFILKKRYLLGIPLASDGFNHTYMAYDMTSNRPMVVKEYFPVGLASRGVDRSHVRPDADEAQNELFVFGKRAFLKEAMTLSDIRMQHVLHVVNYFSENNTAYMVHDYIDGTDLSRHLVIRGGRLSLHEAIEIILPILSTLHKLHKINIFHYNLSLAKIMIVPQGYPVIMGFGQTKQMLSKQSGAVIQTIKCTDAPPEQFVSNAKIGAWSDVYSCGIILYQMITGKMPPTAKERLQKDQWIPASNVQGVKIPVELSDIINHAVTLDTNQRIQSTHELSKAIKTKTPRQTAQKGRPLIFFSTFLFIIFGLMFYYQFFSSNKIQPVSKNDFKRPLIFEAEKQQKTPHIQDTKGYSEKIKSQAHEITPVHLTIHNFSSRKKEPIQNQETEKTARQNKLSQPEQIPVKTLRICGDQELCHQLMPSLVRGFCQDSGIKSMSQQKSENGNFNVVGKLNDQNYQFCIESLQTQQAYDRLQYGRCDIVVSGQKILNSITSSALTKTQEPELCPTEFLVAMDGIVAMVHSENPVQHLSIKELADIFSGKVRMWEESKEIHIYTPKSSSDLYNYFQNTFLNGKKIHATKIFENLDALSRYLHKDPYGIGICSLPFIYDNQPLAIADYEIDPVRPGYFSVSIDSYPIIRNIYLYTILVSSADMTLPFVTFVQSAKGQDIVKQCGYVDCTVKALGSRRELWQKPVNKAVFDKLVKITKQTQKLSMNFYFKSNDYQLTSESTKKLKQLKTWLKRKAGMLKIFVIGYSDSRGAYRQNCLVALKRAEMVAKELKISSIYVDEIVTACEEFPIASNQTEKGRLKNRRVEIWVQAMRMP